MGKLSLNYWKYLTKVGGCGTATRYKKFKFPVYTLIFIMFSGYIVILTSDNIFPRAAARIKSIISTASPGKLYKCEEIVPEGRNFVDGKCPNTVRHVPPAERNVVPLASITEHLSEYWHKSVDLFRVLW